jgi:hypothetical protein
MAAFLPAPTITVPIGQPRTRIMVLHCSPNHSLSLKTLFPRLDTLTLDTKKLANCFKPCSVCAQACASSLSASASQSHKDKGLWQVVGTIGAATAISKFMVCATLVFFGGHICFLMCKLFSLKSLVLMDFFKSNNVLLHKMLIVC